MKHKTHHHKTFITLLLLLVMGLGVLFGRGTEASGMFQMILLFVNTVFLVIITHFLLEIYSGNRVLEVVDVTPRGHLEEAFVPKTQQKPKKTSTTTKKSTKSSTKKAAKKTKKKSSKTTKRKR